MDGRKDGRIPSPKKGYFLLAWKTKGMQGGWDVRHLEVVLFCSASFSWMQATERPSHGALGRRTDGPREGKKQQISEEEREKCMRDNSANWSKEFNTCWKNSCKALEGENQRRWNLSQPYINHIKTSLVFFPVVWTASSDGHKPWNRLGQELFFPKTKIIFFLLYFEVWMFVSAVFFWSKVARGKKKK